VNRLIRVSFGPFQLADLPEGAVEEVRTRVLREQLGERVAAAAGADFSAPVLAREAEAAPIEPPPRDLRSPRVSNNEGVKGRAQRKSRRHDAERLGEPELARRERRGRRPDSGASPRGEARKGRPSRGKRR
jgi:23S rRNA pseudouridine2605 synthase